MVISAPSARQVNKWHCYHPGLGHLGQVYQVYRVYHLARWFCRFETNENIRVGTLKRLALLSQASSKFTNQIFKWIKRSRDIMEVHSVNRMQDGKNCVVSVGNNLAKPNSLLPSIVHIVENSRFWSICSSSLRINESTSPPSVRRKLRLWPCVFHASNFDSLRGWRKVQRDRAQLATCFVAKWELCTLWSIRVLEYKCFGLSRSLHTSSKSLWNTYQVLF